MFKNINLKSSLLKILLLGIMVALFMVTFIEKNDGVEQIFKELVGIKQLTPEGIDFPKNGGGTLSGWAGSEYFKDPIDDPVVLFASAKIPGLAMIYYPTENKLVAGTPQMIVENIQLFQGERHHIIYYFDDEIQKMYYDEKLVAESDFELQGNDLTGFVTGVPEVIVSEAFDVEIS